MKEFTKKQIVQQDKVDNAIHEMLSNLIKDKYKEWDIEIISIVREAIQDALNMDDIDKYKFYPWLR